MRCFPRIKICGITRPQDGLSAAKLGADAVGLVFYSQSPRAVSIFQAQAILRELPVFTVVVGLFVNPTVEEVTQVLTQVPLDRLQFHGDETAEFCAQFSRPYIKALRMSGEIDIQTLSGYPSASALLLDSHVQGMPGGTGTTFDWRHIPHDLPKPVILAGGLTPANVAQAIKQVKPYAVDVSSGVEAAKGIKDTDKMNLFMREVFNVHY